MGNNFNGDGNPLDDKRLTLSGTTEAGKQQYRIWHDGQQIMVPRGQSITKPLSAEIVNANTGVYGDISKGYFRRPIVEFRNTNDYKLFDRFSIKIWRNDLPIEDTDIDYNLDLMLSEIMVKYDTVFTIADMGIDGSDSGVTWFTHSDGENWFTDKLHFTQYNLEHVEGDYYLCCNPTIEQTGAGQSFASGKSLQELNLDITVFVSKATIVNGNSKMDVELKNPTHPVTLKSFNIEIIGGE